jgi:hypothetical protein
VIDVEAGPYLRAVLVGMLGPSPPDGSRCVTDLVLSSVAFVGHPPSCLTE